MESPEKPNPPEPKDEQLDRIEKTLNDIKRSIEIMAVDQATFDAALEAFLSDLTTGLDAIAAKIAALPAGTIDLTNELAQVQAAQAAFDAAVSTDTA